MAPNTGFISRLISGDGKVRQLEPISGIDKIPVVSLAESLMKCDDVREISLDVVQAADEFAEDLLFMSGGKDSNSLTRDEIAAVNAYSQKALFRVLNSRLRDEDRSKLVQWFPYLKLLCQALLKIPDTQATVFRGVNPTVDITCDYKKDRKVRWWAFSSCTLDGSIISQNAHFLGKNGAYRVLFSIDCFHGKDIRRYSMYADEAEVVLPPGTQLRVKNRMPLPDGCTLIAMDELDDGLARMFRSTTLTGVPMGRSAMSEQITQEVPSASLRTGAHAVHIRGATGPHAKSINGVYRPSDDIHDGRVVYQKEDGEHWIEYHKDGTRKDIWLVKATGDRGKQNGLLCAKSCSDAHVVEKVR